MGRPSRKRSRPPSLPERSVARKPHTLLPRAPCRFEKYSNLQSLVKSGVYETSSKARDTETTAADAVVQRVWGTLREADITPAAAPNLSLGVNFEVDGAGVAWLVNAPSRCERTSSLASSSGDCKSQCTGLSEICFQQNGNVGARPIDATAPGVTDAGHPAAAAAAAETGCCPVEDKTRAAYGCRGQEKVDEDAPRSFCLCEEALRAELSRLKDEFDDIPPTVFKRARSACNPAESLGSGPFLNRSAMKLANIDAIAGLSTSELKVAGRSAGEAGAFAAAVARGAACSCNGRLCSAARSSGTETRGGCRQMAEEREPSCEGGQETSHMESPRPLLFADLCGGPGGFSEYLLRRRRQLELPARGWGISLREGTAVETRCPRGLTTDDDSDGCKAIFQGKPVIRKDCNVEQGGGFAGGVEDAVHDRLNKDPCAWRLDRLARWCDVLTTGTSETVECADRDDAPRVATTAARCALKEEASAEPIAIGGTALGTTACPLSRNAIDTCVCGSGGGVDNGAFRLYDQGRRNDCKRDTSAALKRDGIISADGAHSRIVPGAAASRLHTTPAAPVTTNGPALLEMRIDYGPDGTGDLTEEANMYGFVDAVLASTGGQRLDLVVADGGFGAARDAREQERLILPLVHSEALTALLLLEEGGSFLCKLFEVWTKPTASLVYLLHRKFRRIAIVKPITSRPASGERYLVCTGLLPRSSLGCRYTDCVRAKVRQKLQRCPPADTTEGKGDCSADVLPCAMKRVELEMMEDAGFASYLRLTNDRLATLQAKACTRIVDVASSNRGRAWAFRHGKGNSGGDRVVLISATSREAEGDGEGGWECGTGSDAAALQCFREAWGLEEL